MSARFEVVRTDAEQPWHARFIAENNEPVWSTENLVHREDAVAAVHILSTYLQRHEQAEIREVDERGNGQRKAES